MKKKKLLISRLFSSSIQTILSFVFALLLIIGTGLIAILIYTRFQLTTQQNIMKNTVNTLEQTNQYLDSHLQNMIKASETVYYQIVKGVDFQNQSIDQLLNFYYNANRENVVSIALFDIYGDVISATPLSKTKSTVNIKHSPGFQEALDEIENVHFSTPHVQNLFENQNEQYQWVVSLSRNVHMRKGKKNMNGVLLLDINFAAIEQICRSASLQENSYLYLIDSNGEIIYHPRQQLIYSSIEQENNIQAAKYEDGTHEETFNGQKRMITVKTVGYTGWKLVAVIPDSEIAGQVFEARFYTMFVFLIGLSSLLLVSRFISVRIAQPIKKLEKGMQEIENGNLDLQLMSGGSSEIQQLTKSINSMVAKMRELLDNVIEEQEAKRKMELDALQTQINPHFLYNTLDSVIWMVENERYQGAIEMITALARLFRISLSKGNSIITIQDELQHAKSYMVIQSIRYKNKFTYEFDVDENLLEYVTLKIVLQPLIENAIYHGLEFMEADDGGKIIVRVYEKDDTIYLEVEDNGTGMTPSTMNNLFKQKEKKKGSGVGMINVKRRIELYFKEPYGLQVFSEPDEGTMIQITLPKKRIDEVKANEQI